MSLKRIGRKDAILSGLFPKSTAFSKPAICLIYALAEFHQFDGEVPIRGIWVEAKIQAWHHMVHRDFFRYQSRSSFRLHIEHTY